MVENKFEVPKKQWKKWNDVEQQCFIDLYESMIENPWAYDPQLHMTYGEDWKTLAWNAAFMAADLQRYNRKFNG